jgi:steroid delta-isomerase-like uncharacterized protein
MSASSPTPFEDRKAFVHRFAAEFWNGGNEALAGEFVGPGYVCIQNGTPDHYHGAEGLIRVAAKWRRAFPDMHLTLDDVIVEGDKVASAWTFTGTHTGELDGVAPTNRPVKVAGATIFIMANGKFVREVIYADLLGMMQQLGLVPG